MPSVSYTVWETTRLGVLLWPAVQSLDRRNQARQGLLDELNRWRNAIAHQDFDPVRLGGRTTLVLAQVQRWRTACEALAQGIDEVMRAQVHAETGVIPW